MPTTNPVPSQDPTDLLFNAGKLDEVVNGTAQYYADRLGVNRRTVEGISAAADVVLGGLGYAPPVTYASGISMTLTTQTVEYSGEIYAPKVASLPFTTSTWATDSAKFRLIQGVAATDLAASGGAGMIGYMPEGAGAVATTVQKKLRESVNVTDFYANGVSGAKVDPTGVIDSTAGIQAAINAAAGVAKVVFPAGTYKITASRNTMPFPYEGGIKIPSNSYLSLDPAAVIQVAPNSLDKHFCLSIYAAQNVIIEGGQIIGDRTTHTYPNLFNTLADLNTNNYRTKDNYDADPPTWTDGKVAYVYLDSAANNGTYTRTAGAWVRTSATLPNYMTHEFGFGISVINSQNIWINRVQVSGLTGDSIYIQGVDVKRVFVTNCRLATSRRQGISIVDGDEIVITGNHFQDIGVKLNFQDGTAPRSGIDIESGSGSKSDNVIISGNIFTNCVSASINQYDGNNVTIIGNTADTGMSYGFGVNTTITGNTIINGIISGNGARVPIAFTYTQAGTLMTATMTSAHGLKTGETGFFDFLDANGFVVYSGGFAVTVLSITTLTFDTPGFSSASGNGRFKYALNNVSIIGNTLMNGGINATGNGILIANNIMRRGSVYIFSTANDVLISDNQISEYSYGVTGTGGYTGVKITSNRIWNCTIVGIRVHGVNTVVSDNHVTKCVEGIRNESTNSVISGNYINLSGYPTTPSIGIFSSGNGKIINNTVENHTGSYAISCTGKVLLQNNRVIGWTGGAGIYISTANSDGSSAIGNIVECARTSIAAGNFGLGAVNNTKFRAIGNVIYGTNAAMVRAIDTAGSTNSRITNNVIDGAINSNGSDTLTGNVAY